MLMLFTLLLLSLSSKENFTFVGCFRVEDLLLILPFNVDVSSFVVGTLVIAGDVAAVSDADLCSFFVLVRCLRFIDALLISLPLLFRSQSDE